MQQLEMLYNTFQNIFPKKQIEKLVFKKKKTTLSKNRFFNTVCNMKLLTIVKIQIFISLFS